MAGENNFDAVCFPLVLLGRKNKKDIYCFSVNTKNILSHVLRISEILPVLCTRELNDIFITFDEIYYILVFTSKKINILYVFSELVMHFFKSLHGYIPSTKTMRP